MELRGNSFACVPASLAARLRLRLLVTMLFLWTAPLPAVADPGGNSDCTIVSPGAGVLQGPTGGSGDPDDYDLMPEGNSLDDTYEEIVALLVALAKVGSLMH